MRFLLYLLWSLISLLVVILVSITLLLTVYKDEVEHKLVSGIEKFTQRDISIEGGLGFYFNPWPTFVAKDIKMSNASWSNEPYMLEVKSLAVSVSVVDLLHGEINLHQVYADSPLVLIEGNDALNDINWLFRSTRKPRPLVFMAKHFRINNARIDNAKIRIRVGRVAHDLNLDIVNGEAAYFTQAANIQAIGTLDRQELELDIKLDTLRSMFLRTPTSIQFQGHQGRTQIQGRGNIADLLRWRGHEIQLELQAPSLKDVQSWVETRLIDTPPLRASARFIQPERWNSARFEDILVISDALDGETTLTGGIEKLKNLEGIDLSGEMNYPLASIIRWKGKSSRTDAQLEARLKLYGNKAQALHFEIVEASLKGQGMDFRAAGKINDLLAPDTEGIAVTGKVDSVALIGAFTDQKWFATGPLGGGFEIAKKAGRLSLNKVDIKGFEQRASLTGTLDDISGGQLGNFNFKALLNEADVKQINERNGLHLSSFKSTAIDATIDMQQVRFAAPEFAMKLQSPGLVFKVKGAVDDLKNLQTRKAEITLLAESVGDINHQFSIDLPELGQVKASGLATGNISRYDIANIQGTMLNPNQSYSVLGKISAAGSEMKTDLAVVSEIESVDNILRLLESDINIPGAMHATAHAQLISQSATDWTVRNIVAKFDGEHQGTLTGSVSHFPAKANYDLELDLRRVNLEAVIDLDAVRTLQPENASVYMQIRKAAGQDNYALNNIDGQFNMAGGLASLKLAGDIDDIINLEGISLDLGLSSPDLKAVPYLSSMGFRGGIGGVASMKMTGNTQLLEFDISSLKMADTDIEGRIKLDLTDALKRPYFSGQIISENLDILALLEDEDNVRLFSDAPLGMDWIKSIDANVDFYSQRVNGMVSQLSDASLSISIHDGVLNAPDLNGSVGAGHLSVWYTVDTNSHPYDMVIAIVGENVAPEHLNLFGDSGLIRGGLIDVDIGLAGSGNTIAEFMGSASGKILLELHDSSIKNQNIELFGADLMLSVLNVINPEARKSAEYLPIECGVIHFPVAQGNAVASQGIAFKTDRVTVLGGGVIDFDQEMVELIIRPKARKGIGFSAGTVANIAKISGPFEDTRVILDTSALVQSTAAIGMAIVSGGWSLLAQGLLDRNIANSDVCNQTLTEPNKGYFTRAVNVFDSVIGGER